MVCNNGITDEFPGAWGYQHELAECEGAWPLSSVDRLLWHVPFRLVEGVDPDHVQHVRSIGGG